MPENRSNFFVNPNRVTRTCGRCKRPYPSWVHLGDPTRCSNCANQDAVEDAPRDKAAERLLQQVPQADWEQWWSGPLVGPTPLVGISAAGQKNDGYMRDWQGRIIKWWNGTSWMPYHQADATREASGANSEHWDDRWD